MPHGVQHIRQSRRIDVSGACGLNFAAVTDGSCCIELGHRRGHCGSLLSLHYRISTVCLLKNDIAGRGFAICTVGRFRQAEQAKPLCYREIPRKRLM